MFGIFHSFDERFVEANNCEAAQFNSETGFETYL
jgi:hypothetical protein